MKEKTFVLSRRLLLLSLISSCGGRAPVELPPVRESSDAFALEGGSGLGLGDVRDPSVGGKLIST